MIANLAGVCTRALKGMLPLAHAERLIVKVNGDYLDTRIRNTTKELGEYDPAMCDFLDRVFDEFGLIVCGWSAEWDTALCHCIERCNTHRFTTYWTARSTLTGRAQAVATLRRAASIRIQDADTFFTDLADKLAVLEDVEAQHPLSAKIAVAQALFAPCEIIARSETEKSCPGLVGGDINEYTGQ
jgi:hypothetical protein